jgi:hypothetical protein
MDIVEFLRLVQQYGVEEWIAGYCLAEGDFNAYKQASTVRNSLAQSLDKELQALSDEFASLRADVTDCMDKARHWKLAWETQRDVMRNLEVLAGAATRITDLASDVTDGISDPELWKAGVKLLRMALKGERND